MKKYIYNKNYKNLSCNIFFFYFSWSSFSQTFERKQKKQKIKFWKKKKTRNEKKKSPMTSRPDKEQGQPCDWMAVGFSNPSRRIHCIIYSGKLEREERWSKERHTRHTHTRHSTCNLPALFKRANWFRHVFAFHCDVNLFAERFHFGVGHLRHFFVLHVKVFHHFNYRTALPRLCGQLSKVTAWITYNYSTMSHVSLKEKKQRLKKTKKKKKNQKNQTSVITTTTTSSIT